MTAEQEILSAYGENPNAIYSINEISRRIGKAYPHVHKTVHELVKRGVLKRHEVGRSHLCSINLHSTQAVLLLALNHTDRYETLSQNVKQRVQALQAHKQDIDIVIYHPTEDALIIVAKKSLPQLHTITAHQLRQRLLEDESLYAEHIVIAGYEHFYTLIATAEITRRYHPLL